MSTEKVRTVSVQKNCLIKTLILQVLVPLNIGNTCTASLWSMSGFGKISVHRNGDHIQK